MLLLFSVRVALKDYLFGEELFFRFTGRVHRERSSVCVLGLVLRMGCRI